MQDLSVAFIQASLHWEQPEANLAMFEEMLWDISGKVDVVILPEMFTTGFTMNASKVAEHIGLTTTRWMAQQAKQLDAAVVGSFVVQENGSYYNRLLWMFPDGSYQSYNKRHLFRMANEDSTYTAGDSLLVVEWRGWLVCPLICYDLRFPVWSRNTYEQASQSMAYDCLLYVANWPQARVNAWTCLLQARAIENLCYAIGVNRIGEDGIGVAYNGQSAIYSPKGEALVQPNEQQGVFQHILSGDDLTNYRKKFPAYLDADKFSIHLSK